MSQQQRSVLEDVKAGSAYLRGTLAEELANDAAAFDKDTTHILKFHGIYQQDDRDVRRERGQEGLDRDYVCMVRASIPGGRLTADQYLVMDRLADQVGNGSLRITTRQGIQYHFVRKGDLRGLVGSLNRHLVTTLAGCGDVVRNVMCCPAALADREHAGLQQVAAELSRQLKPKSETYWQLWLDGQRAVSAAAPSDGGPDEVEPLYGSTYLPRKFKIGLAFPGDNCVDVYTHDIGIVPHLVDGRPERFTIVVGGGLGMSHNNPATYPRLGDPLCTVERDELLETVTAIIGIQRDHGDRGDRKHARMKYLVADWGLDAFGAELSRRLGRALKSPQPLSWAGTDDHLGWHPQGGEDIGFLGVRVPNGRIVDDGVRWRSGLRRAVERFGVGMRFTPRQDVLLTDVSAADRPALEATLRGHGIPLVGELAPTVRHAMACPALPTCGLAIAEAERVLPDVIDTLQRQLEVLGLGREAIHVRMTGCPNGCARPYSTEVGLVGRGKDHYTIFLGGDANGTRLNRVYADRIPVAGVVGALRPVLAAYRDERRAAESFGDFCDRLGVAALRERLQPERGYGRAAAEPRRKAS